jgi:hypothetical protein
MSGARILLLEMEVYRPGGAVTGAYGWGSAAWGAPLPVVGALESTDTIRASDLGYRSQATDPGGVVTYPPTLDTAFEIDRRVSLHPSSPAAAVAWGTVRLANLGRQYDAVSVTRNSDGRPLRVLSGRRLVDETRGLELDPPYAALVEVFAGVAQPWRLAEGALQVPLRDATAMLERPLQQSLYGGTGGYDGGEDLKGRRMPRVRGGTAALPVRDVTPVWIDRASGILQVSDAPGIVVRVSEAGDPDQILPAGQVADLYSGSVASGYWRWASRADGLYIQLGSPTNLAITADVVGHFPSGTAASTAAEIARRIMREDLQLPLAQIDEASFAALDAALPWVAGDAWTNGEEVQAVDAIGLFLASLGAKLIPRRDGRLAAWTLRPLPADAVPAARYDTAELIEVRASDRLAQAGLYPPPYRWRVGWGRTNTVLTANLDPDLTDARVTALAEEFRIAPWFDPALALAYRNPNDPATVPTRLLDGAQAGELSRAIGEQWQGAPRLYDVVLPMEVGMRREIGDVVRLAYPLDNLDTGRLGQVVGEQVRSGDTTTTLQVLVQ